MKLDNRVHPELQPMFSQLPEQPTLYDLESIQGLRKILDESTGLLNPPIDLPVRVTDKHISGPTEGQSLRMRIYEPTETDGNHAGMYWVHGGGLSTGSPEQDENLLKRFAVECGFTVAAVDYRLAPESLYPAALDDCYAGLVWFSEEAESLNVDPSRIGVAGNSAGAGLAVALALYARDRNGPSLTFLLPLYPMLDESNSSGSSLEITDDRIWNREKNIASWQMYLGDKGRDPEDYYASPSRATDLSGLPPTYTCVGELDPFRDETIEFVQKLLVAQVPVEFHLYPGCFHACEMSFPFTEIGQRIQNEYVRAAREFAEA